MLCKCGCGEEFTPSKLTEWRIKKGMDSGYKSQHQNRGVRNNHWQGGRFISKDGYVYLLRPDHPNALKKGYVGYVAEHRMVMSDHLGRPLLSTELVHHDNEDKTDNRLGNLKLISRADHLREHHSGPKNTNWDGGRRSLMCQTCVTQFLPQDRRNDYGAKYCSRRCFSNRNVSS